MALAGRVSAPPCFIANFISESVLVGFKSGNRPGDRGGSAAQVCFGLHVEKKPGFFPFATLAACSVRSPKGVDSPTVLALGRLFSLLFGLKRLARAARTLAAGWPWRSASCALWGARSPFGVELVGAVPTGLPRLSLGPCELNLGRCSLARGGGHRHMKFQPKHRSGTGVPRASDRNPLPNPRPGAAGPGELANIGGGPSFSGWQPGGGHQPRPR